MLLMLLAKADVFFHQRASGPGLIEFAWRLVGIEDGFLFSCGLTDLPSLACSIELTRHCELVHIAWLGLLAFEGPFVGIPCPGAPASLVLEKTMPLCNNKIAARMTVNRLLLIALPSQLKLR